MIWYALVIPLVISVIGYFLFKHKITWWELFIPTIVSFIAILISFYSMKSTTLSDVEYNGYIITEARYYESYETWVKKTCSRTICTGSGKNRHCHTIYYDCSYCDYNSEYYVMIDSGGNQIGISREKYLSLIKQWNAKPEFIELNRDINYRGGCGKDGDMYSIKWNGHIQTSETSTYTKDFQNILKCNHSAFNYPVITIENAKKAGLYEYPKIYEYNYQPAVLGLEHSNIKDKNSIRKTLEYINGAYGEQYKVKIFTLFFKEKDINTAFLQEAYWDGGNQNEIIVCIGVDKIGNVTWVKPFSWCDNKRVLVELREELSDHKVLTNSIFLNTYKNVIQRYWHYKSFEDFNYLSFEPTKGQLIFIYVFTTIISILTLIWCIKNEIDPEKD